MGHPPISSHPSYAKDLFRQTELIQATSPCNGTTYLQKSSVVSDHVHVAAHQKAAVSPRVFRRHMVMNAGIKPGYQSSIKACLKMASDLAHNTDWLLF